MTARKPAAATDELAQRRAARPPGIRTTPPFTPSDAGNGELLAWANRDRIRYVTDWALWLVYVKAGKSGYWKRDRDGRLMRRIFMETIRKHGRTFKPAEGASESERRKAATHPIDSEKLERQRAAIICATAVESVCIESDQLDPDPYLFCVRNGTLNLRIKDRRKRLRPSDPADMITHQAPISYDPAAELGPATAKFLHSIQPDPKMFDWIKRLLGYCLTGSTREQASYFFHGPGSNGKSKLLELAIAAAGKGDDGYGHISAGDLLIKDSKGTPSNAAHAELVELQGRRIVKASETGESRWLDEDRLKTLAGDEGVNARLPHAQHSVVFMPVCKIITATNHLPRVKGQDWGLWRKVVVVPFDQTFTPEDGTADKDLMGKLLRELPGFLTWLTDGAAEYLADDGCLDRQNWPAQVREATQDYRDKNDPVSPFFRDDCVVNPPGERTKETCHGVKVKPGDFYDRYTKWAARNNYYPLRSDDFFKKVSTYNFERGREHSGRYIYGVRPSANDDGFDVPMVETGEPCRVCGEPCAADNNGIHPLCELAGIKP